MHKKQSILIVDDDESCRLLLKHYLSDLDLTLFETNSGKSSIQICHKQRLNIIILDIQMPAMNGLEAVNKIRNINSWYQNIPILALTATNNIEESSTAEKYGFTECLIKPIKKEILQEKICHYTNHIF